MAYAIIRAAKIKTAQQGGIIHSHNSRSEFDKDGEKIIRENVDESRTRENTTWQNIGNDVNSGIQFKLDELNITPRKNAVLGIEYIVSASPEFFEKGNYVHSSYLQNACKFIYEKHGMANVISTTYHFDEQTPHAHVVVVPIDAKGKLNCREFLGGKEKLSTLQDEFHAHVKHMGRPLAGGVLLERGEKYGTTKYVEKTSHVLGSLRREVSEVAQEIEKLNKASQQALKDLNIDEMRKQQVLIQEQIKQLEVLKEKQASAEKEVKKIVNPEKPKNKGLGM